MLRRLFPSALLSLFFAAALTARGADAPVLHCQPGPWGRIDYQFIYLAAPESILDNFPMPSPQSRWCFTGRTLDSVHTFLNGAGVDPATSARLVGDTRSKPDEEGVITLFPTEEEILALSATTRETVYRELAKYEENPFYHDPVVIPDGNLDAWLRGTDMPKNIADLIGKLAYKDGDSLLFSDFRVILKYADSDAEARHWVGILTRIRAVVAYLNLGDQDDMAGLRRYWSANSHRMDVVPMLDAAAGMEGGSRLDITHLFPPLPRRLVYSYTSPDIERTGQTPNCHWTSLNFFNYTRQNILLDLKLATSRVLEDYDRVQPPYQFGDVFFFLNKDGNAYHSCVYIADNLVFSKNGENEMMPWILARLDDIKQLYGREPGYTIMVFRRRWPEGT
jgi:hypothetical protein